MTKEMLEKMAELCGLKADASEDSIRAAMKEKGLMAVGVKKDDPIQIDAVALAEKTTGDERKRMQEILAVSADYPELEKAAKEAVLEGKSVEEFKSFALTEIKKLNVDGNRIDVNPETADIGLSTKEVQKYSWMNVIRAQVLHKPELAEFEREASDAVRKQLKLNAPRGMYIPQDVLQARAQNATTDSAGGYLVETDLKAESFIERLKKDLVMGQMGATVLNGLVGDIAIPRMASGSTAYWLAENADITESATVYDQVTMTPKTVGAYVDMTRQLMLQSTPAIEQLVKDDVRFVLAEAIDLAAIDGSGDSNQPTGLLQTSGISNGDWATANTPTWGEVVGLESTLGAANSLKGNLAYLTTPAFRGTMKTTVKESGYPTYIMAEGNELNGYPCMVSNNMQAATLALGNWRDLLIGFWGTLDMTVDPYTLSKSGGVRIVVFQSCDAAARHGASFAVEENAGS